MYNQRKQQLTSVAMGTRAAIVMASRGKEDAQQLEGLTPFRQVTQRFHCMLWQISLAPLCERRGGKDFPTALHAVLRQDGKLCCFSKLSEDTWGFEGPR